MAVVIAAMASPSAASASPVKQYVLKHPKRERCKAHYVKRAEHGRTWCVRLSPTYVAVAPSFNTTRIVIRRSGS